MSAGPTMELAKTYRQYAGECRKLAGHMPTRETRAQMLAIAAGWEELAARQDRRLGLKLAGYSAGATLAG